MEGLAEEIQRIDQLRDSDARLATREAQSLLSKHECAATYGCLATCLAAIGRTGEAESYLLLAMQSASEEEIPLLLQRQGKMLTGAGDYAGASVALLGSHLGFMKRGEYREAAKVLIDLGRNNFRSGDLESAKQFLDQALELPLERSYEFAALITRGGVRSALGDSVGARVDASDAKKVEKPSESPWRWALEGDIQEKAANYLEAGEHYNSAAEGAEECGWSLHAARFLAHAAALYLRAGAHDSAQSVGKKAARLIGKLKGSAAKRAAEDMVRLSAKDQLSLKALTKIQKSFHQQAPESETNSSRRPRRPVFRHR